MIFVFLVFPGIMKWNIGQKWVKVNILIRLEMVSAILFFLEADNQM